MSRIAAVLTALLCSVAHAGTPPVPSQFAWSFAIETPAATPMHRLVLGAEVYRSVGRADLGDIRVFNADGEAVPHMIAPPRKAVAAAGTPVALRFFPLHGHGARDGGTTPGIRVDAAGAIIEITPAPEAAGAVDAYLVDADALRAEIAGLTLAWAADAPGFVSAVTLETSPDLRAWRTVGGATLAKLEHDGHRLAQPEVALTARADRYLRLSWPAGRTGVALLGVGARLRGADEQPPRLWLPIGGAPAADSPQAREFDAGAWLPADRVRVAFAQQNSIANLRIRSRAGSAEPWRERGSALFYRLLVDGTELRNPELALDAARQRYWRVDSRDAGAVAVEATLELGWIPDELVFMARGPAPFRLAAGSAAVGPADAAVARLLGDLDQARQQALVGAATLGERSVLAGPGALLPAPPPVPWQRYLLWSLLVGGVLLLLGMALQLYRQMAATRPPAS